MRLLGASSNSPSVSGDEETSLASPHWRRRILTLQLSTVSLQFRGEASSLSANFDLRWCRQQGRDSSSPGLEVVAAAVNLHSLHVLISILSSQHQIQEIGHYAPGNRQDDPSLDEVTYFSTTMISSLPFGLTE